MTRVEHALVIALLVASLLGLALTAIHCPAWEVALGTVLVFVNQFYWSYRHGGE